MATASDSTNSSSLQHKPYFIYSPQMVGPSLRMVKPSRMSNEDASPLTGEILASAQDARVKIEELALYLRDSLRLKGSPKARRLADEALDPLARTINSNYKIAGGTP